MELVQMESISEQDSTALATYLVNSAIALSNGYFVTQMMHTHESHFHVVFNQLSDSMFDESKLALLPSLCHAVFLLTKQQLAMHESYYVHEPQDEVSEAILHPLVPSLLKRPIPDKSLYLLRVLSSLMTLPPTHPHVLSMLWNLSIFFEFAFPMAFEEIKAVLDSTVRRITSQSESPSLVTSLLTTIMKLINDRQFRISLCTALVHEVGSHQFQAHTRNCLTIFGTMVPVIPADVASANIEKLFQVLPFEDQDVSATFSELLGAISGSNDNLIIPLIKTWTSSRAFIVGRQKSALSPQFIAMTLAGVAKDVPVASLVKSCHSDLVSLLVRLTKTKDAHPGFVLNALSELCQRLGFQKSSSQLLDDKQLDYFLKYVLTAFSSAKTKQLIWQCLNSLRLLIQVPPCLGQSQFTALCDKLLSSHFLNHVIADPLLSSEFRGLCLAVICVLPHTTVLLVFLKTFLPLLENPDILSLAWRMLSIFESYARNDPGPIRFFKPLERSKLGDLPRLLVEFLAASYPDVQLALQSAVFLVHIDRTPAAELSTVGDVVGALADDEFRVLCGLALERASLPYTFVLSLCLKRDRRALSPAQLEALCCDVLARRLCASPDLVQQLVLADSALFFGLALRADDAALDVLAQALALRECAELLFQHAATAVLAMPQADAPRVFWLCGALLGAQTVPRALLFQLVVALLVFGFGSRRFGDLRRAFLPEVQRLEIVERLLSAADGSAFSAVWKAAVARVTADADLSVVATLVALDEASVGDAINFVLSTSAVTNPAVSSAIVFLCGEVLNHVAGREQSALFNLSLCGLLSLSSVEDVLTCICILNEVTKFLRKETASLPDEFVFRILRALQKGSASGDPEVRVFVCLCLSEFCTRFAQNWSDDVHNVVFAVVLALLKAGQFAGPATVLTILNAIAKSEVNSGFRNKYALLHRLAAFHFDGAIAAEAPQDEVEEFDGMVALIEELTASQVSWITGAALRWLVAEKGKFVGMFRERIVELLSHEDDSVAEAAENAFAAIVSDGAEL
jgi:hypothetical protein